MKGIKKEILENYNSNFFFGYYDKTPWSISCKKILSHNVRLKSRLPNVNDYSEIGFFQKSRNKNWNFKKLDETNMWNFQQGAMLQWIAEDKIIYNKLYKKKIVSKVLNVNNNKSFILNLPIYCLSNSKNFFLSTSFDQISINRKGYNLPFVENKNLDKKNHGIWIFDLKNKKNRLLIPFEFFFDNGYVDNNKCWIDHILLSPDDKKFVFFLRKTTSDGGVYTRLFKYEFLSDSIECVLDTGMASHGDWLDNDNFVIWARKNKAISNLLKNDRNKTLFFLKKIYRNIKIPNWVRDNIFLDRFLILNLRNSNNSFVFNNLPLKLGGGHFSIDRKIRKWVLNDIPLNSDNYRSVIIHDLQGNIIFTLDTLYADPKLHYSTLRCDLHPRWSPDYKKICIDNINARGNRTLIIYDIEELDLF